MSHRRPGMRGRGPEFVGAARKWRPRPGIRGSGPEFAAAAFCNTSVLFSHSRLRGAEHLLRAELGAGARVRGRRALQETAAPAPKHRSVVPARPL